jgi:hypothetical protein
MTRIKINSVGWVLIILSPSPVPLFHCSPAQLSPPQAAAHADFFVIFVPFVVDIFLSSPAGMRYNIRRSGIKVNYVLFGVPNNRLYFASASYG